MDLKNKTAKIPDIDHLQKLHPSKFVCTVDGISDQELIKVVSECTYVYKLCY